MPWGTPIVIAQREEEELKKHDQVRKGDGSILIDSLIDKVFKGRETDSDKYFSRASGMRTQMIIGHSTKMEDLRSL